MFPNGTMNFMPEPLTFRDRVRVRASATTDEQGIAGAVGEVVGISAEEGAEPAAFAVSLDGVEHVWMVEAVDLERE
jgi:hypothetical protein